MIRKKLIYISLLVLAFLPDAKAQDPHFSQYFNSPFFQNPASAGNFPGKHRVVTNYRRQWQSVTVPYQTFTIAYDRPWTGGFTDRDKVGAGIEFVRDKAGDSDFGIVSAMIGLSYQKSIGRKGNQSLAAGLKTGWAQRSINYGKLRFPSQYNGSYYDPSMSTGEVFPIDNFSYWDISCGFQWTYLTRTAVKYSAGLSYNHINRPKQSLLGDESLRLDPRLNVSAFAAVPLGEGLWLIPSMQYEAQKKYSMFLAGSLLRYDLPGDRSLFHSCIAGLHTRWNDAAYFSAGLEYREMSFCVSYDINYSGLRKASLSRGGLEFSLIVILGRQNIALRREITCPIF